MWESNRVRLLCMLTLTFIFFVVEVVVSRITGSLAMLSDSFHMLSDVIALVVGLVAVRFAQKTRSTDKNTFGWIRAGVVGALVNAIFLTALCFTIVLEAIERFTEPQAIEQPLVVIGVGAGGLLINLIGLCMFRDSAGLAHGHGHSHGGGSSGGGHGHSHGAKKPHKNRDRSTGDGVAIDREETNILVDNCGNSHGVIAEGAQGKHADLESTVEHRLNGKVVENNSPEENEDGSQLNMRGVFLHVLGDALGSVIVVVNALVFYFVFEPCITSENCINPCINNHCTDHKDVNHTHLDVLNNSLEHEELKLAGPCWVLYLDPALCVFMVCILLYTTYPLLKESALILLQTVPKQIDISSLKTKLRSLEGVEAVHELHVWQLAESRIIATAHIKCHDPTSYMDVAKRIKDFFHDEGIHATTIQPEFSSVESGSRVSLCELSCRTQCAPKQCCGSSEKNSSGKKTVGGTPSFPSLAVISESPEHTSKRTTCAEKASTDFPIEVDSTV
ncbi:proton-coupled zinc antiporter SLC30A1 [Bombina bombina]|uniref:proton-coupled zinc antiporter SLC30A1 n=1 Tax=Bombina bombina TaxID=8345 RepID=UPI00235A8157|nr:proton-coupled zinc antiporter SLC30A1 [Bombina bombina]